MNKLNLSYGHFKYTIIILLLFVFIDTNGSILSLLNPDFNYYNLEYKIDLEKEGDFEKLEREGSSDEALFINPFSIYKIIIEQSKPANNFERNYRNIPSREISTPPPENVN
ncbi:MAG: hypothetical protein OEY34_00520 [Cyclobacteriaceae bacterium]|nr:hypothetical protein [Cyclobacteriaceae bacterium]